MITGIDTEKNKMISMLVDSALSGNEAFVITRMLKELKLVKPHAEVLREVLISEIDGLISDKKHWLAVEYWELIIDISKGSSKQDEYHYGQSHALSSWAYQSENDGNVHSAADHLRQAVTLLKGLSNRFKETKNIVSEIEEIELRLVEIRKKAKEQFNATAEYRKIDLSEEVELTKKIVTGKSIEELIYLPDTEYRHIIRLQRRLAKRDGGFFFRRFFGGVSYSDDDGRRLGTFGSETKQAEKIESYRLFNQACDRQVVGYILPALDILKRSLNIQESYFHELSASCSIVPDAQKRLVAKALWHGYNEDFESSIMLLSPLSESILRHILKESGIPTVTIEQTSESEKSMGMLLNIAREKAILNREVVFKIEAIFTSQFGLNFRNKAAHGLVTDNFASSLSAVYVWWLCLKWIIIYSPPKQ